MSTVKITHLKGIVKFNQDLGVFCGYLLWPLEASSDQLQVMEELFHGGITFDGIIDGQYAYGFDCGHYDDVVPALEDYGVPGPWASYKDSNFVLDVLRRTTEALGMEFIFLGGR